METEGFAILKMTQPDFVNIARILRPIILNVKRINLILKKEQMSAKPFVRVCNLIVYML